MIYIPKWTGDLVGKMHNAGITNKDLAGRLGVSPEWVSKVLNGKQAPQGAEQRFNEAFRIIAERRQ